MNPTQPETFKDVREAVQALLEMHVDDDANFEKLLQFLRIRKADYYFRGIQYVAPDLSPTGIVDYTPVGSPLTGSDSRGVLDYNIDQVKTFGRKFIATLGQRPFYNMRALPDNPQSEADRMAAREAEKGYFLLRSQWNVKTRNLELAYHAWKSGTVFPYTRYVVDGNRYGYSEEPIIEPRPVEIEPGGYKCFGCGAKSPQLNTIEIPDEFGAPIPQSACPECGQPLSEAAFEPPVSADVPTDTGRTHKYPNGRVELHLFSGMFVTVPFYSTNLTDAPFLDLTCEEHAGRLLSLYPSLREKMKDGELNVDQDSGAIASSGMSARTSSYSQTGIVRGPGNKSLRTWRRTWIRPFFFELVPDEGKRQQLKQAYPDGLKAVRVGKEIVAIESEKPEDYFTTMYPEVGEYVFRDGISWGILQHQDLINDVLNQLAEIVERCNSSTLIWSNVIDVARLNDRSAAPSEFIPVSNGTDLQNSIREMKTPTFPKEAPQLVSIAQENIQTHTGVMPNIFGAGIAGDTTAEANRNQLNQALMQLGTTGEFMIQAWTGAFTNGVKELAKHATRDLRSPADGESIDPEVLMAGNWHFEGETGIPRSFAERKDELKALVMQNPQMAQVLGVDAPVNIGAVRDYLDLPELENPRDDERMFVMELIDELAQGESIQQPPMVPGEPPPPPMPSSTRLLDLVDAGVLDPANTAELIREWVIGPGRKVYGTPGYQNVMAVMQQLKQLMMPPPPEAGMPLPEEGKAPPKQPKGPPTGEAPIVKGGTGIMTGPTKQ